MAKAKKTAPKKPPKKGKYDITVKTNLSFDGLVKLAATTTKKIFSKFWLIGTSKKVRFKPFMLCSF